MAISNETELKLDIGIKVSQAIENTTAILCDELLKIIQQNVYNAYSPKEYIRTEQFLYSWESTVAVVKNYITQSYIQQDLSVMQTDKLINHTKGNFYTNPTYTNHNFPNGKGSLAEVIENGSPSDYHYWGNAIPRPFWNEFELYIDTNIDRIFAEQMAFVGL